MTTGCRSKDKNIYDYQSFFAMIYVCLIFSSDILMYFSILSIKIFATKAHINYCLVH